MAATLCGSLFICLSPVAASADDDMVLIPGGYYSPLFKEVDGSGDIEVEAFTLDRFAVTNQDYRVFTEQKPRWQKTKIKPVFSDVNYLKHWTTETFATIAKQPVTNVSWYAARAYCKSQGKRLPTTSEWEFAAQASADKANGREDPAYRRRILDWYAKPAAEQLPKVNDTAVNFWGVHGMHGVTWELVNDFNTALVTGESRGDSQLEQQLFCGAGAASAVDPSDYAAFMRYALRSSYQAHYTLSSMGFRCAKDIEDHAPKQTGKLK